MKTNPIATDNSSASTLMIWYFLAVTLAIATYFYGLDSQYIPKNGDEYPYAHITRLTAASGNLLPLQSELDNMRNTKPPLLFWQGIVSSDWGKNWSLWNLRYPNVLYTMLTAMLTFLLGWRLSGKMVTGLVAILAFLAFFSTYRFHRGFLTNPAEVFWLFLPFFILLYWPKSFTSKLLIPTLLGVVVGVGLLYKSVALLAPVGLGLTIYYLNHRDYRLLESLSKDTFKLIIIGTVAVGMFGLWFLLDPDPQAVWDEFVMRENFGKFDPNQTSYLGKFIWGGSSIWSLLLSALSNTGLLLFPVVAMIYLAVKQRSTLDNSQKLLWIWLLVLLIVFSLPSQRSGRYILPAMPALGVLCALNWQKIAPKAFVISLYFALIILAAMLWLAVGLQQDVGENILSLTFWAALSATAILLGVGIVNRQTARPVLPVVTMLIYILLATFFKILDGPMGQFTAEAQAAAEGREVWVPCNFRAKQEGHRFDLPGSIIHGYHRDLKLELPQLATSYPLFAVQLPFYSKITAANCPHCQILGERLILGSRHSSQELREMFFAGRVMEHLFKKEYLIATPLSQANRQPASPDQACL